MNLSDRFGSTARAVASCSKVLFISGAWYVRCARALQHPYLVGPFTDPDEADQFADAVLLHVDE